MNNGNMKQEKNEIIYKFIEKELQNNSHPIYAEICRKIYEQYNITVYHYQIAKICKEIAEQKGLDICFKKQRKYMNSKQRELFELHKEADESGITEEEVFLCRLRGYSYSLMCRIYFEITGKTLDTNYFSNKCISYCKKNGIKYARNIQPKKFEDILNNMSTEEFEAHSKFFKRLYLEEKKRNSANARQSASKAASDPYNIIHNEVSGAKNNTQLQVEHDER